MRTVLLATLVLTVLTPAAYAQTEFPAARVAFFNADRVTAESALGKAGLAKLEEYQVKTNREIQEQNQELEAEREQFQQSASVLNPDAQRERERAIQNFELDLQRFIEDAQAEFLGIRQEVERNFLVTLEPVIEDVAQEKNVHFVFNWPSVALFYADPRFDVTGDIIERLDEAARADD